MLNKRGMYCQSRQIFRDTQLEVVVVLGETAIVSRYDNICTEKDTRRCCATVIKLIFASQIQKDYIDNK